MTSVLLFLLPAIAFFALQFYILRKTERRLLRLIPVGLLAVIFASVGGMFVLEYADGPGGVAFWTIIAMLTTLGGISALIGDVLAWIIHSGW